MDDTTTNGDQPVSPAAPAVTEPVAEEAAAPAENLAVETNLTPPVDEIQDASAQEINQAAAEAPASTEEAPVSEAPAEQPVAEEPAITPDAGTEAPVEEPVSAQ